MRREKEDERGGPRERRDGGVKEWRDKPLKPHPQLPPGKDDWGIKKYLPSLRKSLGRDYLFVTSNSAPHLPLASAGATAQAEGSVWKISPAPYLLLFPCHPHQIAGTWPWDSRQEKTSAARHGGRVENTGLFYPDSSFPHRSQWSLADHSLSNATWALYTSTCSTLLCPAQCSFHVSLGPAAQSRTQSRVFKGRAPDSFTLDLQ